MMEFYKGQVIALTIDGENYTVEIDRLSTSTVGFFIEGPQVNDPTNARELPVGAFAKWIEQETRTDKS